MTEAVSAARSRPSVSVIIPTYGHRDFVLESVRSVLAQTFTDYELIVVNDGSPDDTAAVLRPLVEQGRIQYIEQANAGQAAARNRGIAAARGEFIALLDDDDVWPADHLQWQVATLAAHPQAVLAYGFCQYLGGARTDDPGRERLPRGRALDAVMSRNLIVSPGQMLIRKSALDQVGGFDPAIWGMDDWELYIRLAAVGEFAFEERVALLYRRHANNASKNFLRMYRNGLRVLAKHHERPGVPAEVRQAGKRSVDAYINFHAIVAAEERAYAGQRASAARTVLRIAAMQPTALLSRRAASLVLRVLMPVVVWKAARAMWQTGTGGKPTMRRGQSTL